jgi:hypothetical protein
MAHFYSEFLWGFFSQAAFSELLTSRNMLFSGQEWMVGFIKSLSIRNFLIDTNVSVRNTAKGFYINFEQQRENNTHLHVSFHTSNGIDSSPTHIRIYDCIQDFEIRLFPTRMYDSNFDIVFTTNSRTCTQYDYILRVVRMVLIGFLGGLLDSQLYHYDFVVVGDLIRNNRKVYQNMGFQLNSGMIGGYDEVIFSTTETMLLLPYIVPAMKVALGNVLPVVEYMMQSGTLSVDDINSDARINEIFGKSIKKLVSEVINSKEFIIQGMTYRGQLMQFLFEHDLKLAPIEQPIVQPIVRPIVQPIAQPMPISVGAGNFYDKYLKYKAKYIKLKKNI